MKKSAIYIVLLLLLGTTAYWMNKKDTGNSIDAKPLTNFAIKDTASIQKIFIVDQQGKSVTLTRGKDRFWLLNGKHKVVQYAIKELLSTFANVGVQSTVPKASQENILRAMAATQRKVMIFGENDQLIKTWYLGSPTKSAQGTYMILETPEEGISSEPYIVEKRGFRGYLTSRFHTTEKDWRWKGVFFYPEMDIKKVTVERPKTPEKGFQIVIHDMAKNDIEFLDSAGKPLEGDMAKIHVFLLQFKKKYVETFDPPRLDDLEEDSVAARTPDYVLEVMDRKGDVSKISLQYKSKVKNTPLEDINSINVDVDRMFGVFNDETIQIQRTNFDPILIDKEVLMKN